MRSILPGAALSLLAAACSAPAEGDARVEVDLPAQARNLEEKPSGATLLHGDDDVTIRLLALRAPVAMHRHARSEEIVYLLSGEGVFRFAHGERALRAGDLVVVPRDTPHGFTPTGAGPAVLLQTFVPHFMEGDRIPEPQLEPKAAAQSEPETKAAPEPAAAAK
jgi:mannose-6-phosphate isomerase-like protein (cupin superfamily)